MLIFLLLLSCASGPVCLALFLGLPFLALMLSTVPVVHR